MLRYSLSELAQALELSFSGSPHVSISGVCSLENPKPDHIAFVTDVSYLAKLDSESVAAVICKPEWLLETSLPTLQSDNPYLSYARVAQLFSTRPMSVIGVHPTAHVDNSAIIGESVSIGPGVVVEANAVLGDNCVIGANTVIGESAKIGAATRIFANVTINHDVVIGSHCEISSGAVIGSDGFGFAPSANGWQAIAQNGSVVIGDRVHIGANTTIDRGAIDHTIIGSDVIIDNLVQIAHNVRIGDYSALAGCVAIAGSASIGRRCLIGGAARIVGHIDICDNVQILACARVTKSITEAGEYASGTPLMKARDWRKAMAVLARSVKTKRM